MRKTMVAAAVIALASSLLTAASPAGATTVDAYLSVDVVVVGTPPPGASIVVKHTQGTGYTPDEFVVDLNGLAAQAPEVEDFVVHDVSHMVWVDPASLGTADDVGYSCAVTGVQGSIPNEVSSCGTVAPNQWVGVIHSSASLWGQFDTGSGLVSERAEITVTVTFDPPCDGREVTVNANRGEVATAGPDVILGTPFNDDLYGLGGRDVICGGGGADTLRGGPGPDRILGGNGADRIEGGDGADALLGQVGNDILNGGTGPDILNGGAGRDRCNGGPQTDTATACEVRTAIP